MKRKPALLQTMRVPFSGLMPSKRASLDVDLSYLELAAGKAARS